jgi:hypothetical protein
VSGTDCRGKLQEYCSCMLSKLTRLWVESVVSSLLLRVHTALDNYLFPRWARTFTEVFVLPRELAWPARGRETSFEVAIHTYLPTYFIHTSVRILLWVAIMCSWEGFMCKYLMPTLKRGVQMKCEFDRSSRECCVHSNLYTKDVIWLHPHTLVGTNLAT